MIAEETIERFAAEHDALEEAAEKAFQRYSELSGDPSFILAATYGSFRFEQDAFYFEGAIRRNGKRVAIGEALPAKALTDEGWWERQAQYYPDRSEAGPSTAQPVLAEAAGQGGAS